MAKVTNEDRTKYNNEIKLMKEEEKRELKKIHAIEAMLQNSKDQLNNYRKISKSWYYLNIVELYCKMNDLSLQFMKRINENHLNEARKNYFNALKELEDFVGKHLDLTYDEQSEILETISKFNPPRVLAFINKFYFTLDRIKKGYGENSRWRWLLVETEARFVTAMKNLTDLKSISSNDPTKAYYEQKVVLAQRIRDLLKSASEHYRDKYSLSTKEIDDMRKAIYIQDELRKINIYLDSPNDVDTCKKTIDLWNNILEKDITEKEKKKKKRKK